MAGRQPASMRQLASTITEDAGFTMRDTDSGTQAATVDETSIRYRGWRVVGVCFVMATLVWGFGFYGHGFYLAELQRLHGWPASLVGGATTLYYLVSALLVVFIGDAMRVLGVRMCVSAGALALAGAVAALPFIHSPWQLI